MIATFLMEPLNSAVRLPFLAPAFPRLFRSPKKSGLDLRNVSCSSSSNSSFWANISLLRSLLFLFWTGGMGIIGRLKGGRLRLGSLPLFLSFFLLAILASRFNKGLW